MLMGLSESGRSWLSRSDYHNEKKHYVFTLKRYNELLGHEPRDEHNIWPVASVTMISPNSRKEKTWKMGKIKLDR